MIETDVVNYLKSDAALDTLLSVTVSDSKIYPIQRPEREEDDDIAMVPYILYNCIVGMEDEILEEDRFQLTIVADNFTDIKSIEKRLDTLLNKQDKIQGDITSTDWIIKYSKRTAGDKFKDEDTKLFHCVMVFTMKYTLAVYP